jgi:two-component system invasion response regulator UvrY
VEKIRVVLVDDHPIILTSLRRILRKARDIEVAAEGRSGREALEAQAQFSPDVLVLDVRLPDMDAAEITRKLLETESNLRIIILSGYIDKEMVQQMLRLGISDHIAKDDAQEWLVPAIRSVVQGVICLSPLIRDQLSGPDPGIDMLTP